jgi:hypothetical protein
MVQAVFLMTVGVASASASGREAPRGGAAQTEESDCVVEWTEAGGPRGERRVLLRVFENGLVEAECPTGQGALVQDRIDPREAISLARKLARGLADADVTTAALHAERQQQARETGLSADIADAVEAVLSIEIEGKALAVSCPAVDLLAERFPMASRHHALKAVQDELKNIQAIVQAGGRDSAMVLAQAATRQLQSEYPVAKEWTVEELAMVRKLPTGTRLIQFRREAAASNDGAAREWWITNIVETPGAPLKASVVAPDRVTR